MQTSKKWKAVCLQIGEHGVLGTGKGFDKDILLQEKLVVMLRYADWRGRKEFESCICMREFKEDFLKIKGDRQVIKRYLRQIAKRHMRYCMLPHLADDQHSVYLMVSFYDIPLYLSLAEPCEEKKRKLEILPTSARNYFAESCAFGEGKILRKLEESAEKNMNRNLKHKKNEDGRI